MEGRARKVKDALRVSARPSTHVDHLATQHIAGDLPPEAQEEAAFAERSMVRDDRAKQFNMRRQFPALLGPKVVPSGRLASTGKVLVQPGEPMPHTARAASNFLRSAAAEAAAAKVEAEQRSSAGHSRVVAQAHHAQGRGRGQSPPMPSIPPGAALAEATTCAHRARCRQKRPDDPKNPWLLTSPAEANDLICNRKPANHDMEYETVTVRDRLRELQADRAKWLGGNTMLPSSVSGAKDICDRSRQEFAEAVAEARQRGLEGQQELQQWFHEKREAYVKAKQGRPISTFEAFADKQSAKEVKDTAPTASPVRSRNSTHSMGFMRGAFAPQSARM